MREEQCAWRSTDGLELFGRVWTPEAEPRAAVCLVHGFGEHSGRYHHVAERLVREQWAVAALDLRGHGRSGGARGYTPSYRVLLDDMGLALNETQRRWPRIPLFLYGHSMGGNLALNYVLRRKPMVQGVIASSPWLRLTHEFSSLFVVYAWMLNTLWPSYSRPTGDDPANLTHDPAVLEILARDQLSHGTISARLFWSIRSAGRWALAHAADFKLPLLVMHGTADRLISPQATQEFAGRAPGDCTLQLWEGLYHELHNELERDAVLRFVAEWITPRT